MSNKIIMPRGSDPADLDASVGSEEELPELSSYFIENDLSAEGAMAIYNKRINYANEFLREYPFTEGIVDFNFAEKHLYGRVDRFYIPMVPNVKRPEPTALELKTIINSSDEARPLSAFNFVVDNFKELSNQFRKATAMRKISATHPFLSTLTAYKGYQNPEILFNKHRHDYYQGIEDIFRDDKVQVANFNDFLVKLMPYLDEICRAHPFTFTAFVKSNYCPAHVSGLVIDIANTKPSEDVTKVEKFLYSVNWEYYVNACNSYGFMIDRLHPWRLVADIASPAMLEKSVAYGAFSTDDILQLGYRSAHGRYFRDFASSLLGLYRRVKKPITKTSSCSSGTRVSTVQPTSYSNQSFSERYNVLYIFRIYCTIRFAEEETPFKDHEKHKLIEDCMEIARHNPQRAVDIFERILNKTFDYIGSLDYIRNKYDRIDKLSTDHEDHYMSQSSIYESETNTLTPSHPDARDKSASFAFAQSMDSWKEEEKSAPPDLPETFDR